MYRCIECKAVFEVKPDYCDCGNDTFEEFPVAPQQQTVHSFNTGTPAPSKKKKYNSKEIVSFVIFAICIILSIFAWIFVGKGASTQQKSQDPSLSGTSININENIPDINQIWDATLPTPQKQVGAATNVAQKPKQLLNSRMSTLDTETRSYVISLGQVFVESWPRGSVVGDGACEVAFAVSKDGKIVDKKIYKPSNNKTLDDSITIMLENVTQTSVPPAGYKGENIVMAFSIQHREFKVYYPKY